MINKLCKYLIGGGGYYSRNYTIVNPQNTKTMLLGGGSYAFTF